MEGKLGTNLMLYTQVRFNDCRIPDVWGLSGKEGKEGEDREEEEGRKGQDERITLNIYLWPKSRPLALIIYHTCHDANVGWDRMIQVRKGAWVGYPRWKRNGE